MFYLGVKQQLKKVRRQLVRCLTDACAISDINILFTTITNDKKSRFRFRQISCAIKTNTFCDSDKYLVQSVTSISFSRPSQNKQPDSDSDKYLAKLRQIHFAIQTNTLCNQWHQYPFHDHHKKTTRLKYRCMILLCTKVFRIFLDVWQSCIVFLQYFLLIFNH